MNNINKNYYEATRRRLTNHKTNKNISDKEIIELLAEEIEQYRRRIENLEKINKEKEIITDKNIFHCGVDGGTGKDFEVIKWFKNGVIIKEEIKPV